MRLFAPIAWALQDPPWQNEPPPNSSSKTHASVRMLIACCRCHARCRKYERKNTCERGAEMRTQEFDSADKPWQRRFCVADGCRTWPTTFRSAGADSRSYWLFHKARFNISCRQYRVDGVRPKEALSQDSISSWGISCRLHDPELHGYIYVSRVFVSETLCQAIQEGSGT